MDEWYYKKEESEFGPISETELRALLAQEKNVTEIRVRRNPGEAGAAALTALPVPPRPAAVPPPLPPAKPSSTAALTRFAGPTVWLWCSAMMLALDLIVLGFMQFVFSIYALFLLAGITGLPDWFIQCVNVLDSRVLWPQAAMFVLIILWQGCAFGSILRLYGHVRIRHGRRSGFWWITPFANLFMPFQCLRELRWASRQKRTASESDISAGALLWMLQVVIVFKILTAIADKLVRGAGTAMDDASQMPTVVNLAINFFGLALGLLLTVFVLRNLVQQIRLYRGWNTPAAAV